MPELDQIRDLRHISPRLATAGQPTASQLTALAAAGFEVVINLLPPDSEFALPDEARQVRMLGLIYESIPVVWEHPTAADWERFAEAMQRHRERRVFVHCVANLRVTTFLALHRVLHEGWSWSAAAAEMRCVWEPNATWADFIVRMLRRSSTAQSPWLRVPPADYEGHMGPAGAGQLAPLSRLFGAHYCQTRPARVAVLGCAVGNGFEQVRPEVTQRLIGIDIHPAYLREARARFPGWGTQLQVICARAEQCPLPAASIDLVSAALIFEYVDPAVLAAGIAELIAPGGHLSVVLQLPSRERGGVVSETAYPSLRDLEGIMRLVPPERLAGLLRANGLAVVAREEIALPFGKAFHAGLYSKGSGTRNGLGRS